MPLHHQSSRSRSGISISLRHSILLILLLHLFMNFHAASAMANILRRGGGDGFPVGLSDVIAEALRTPPGSEERIQAEIYRVVSHQARLVEAPPAKLPKNGSSRGATVPSKLGQDDQEKAKREEQQRQREQRHIQREKLKLKLQQRQLQEKMKQLQGEQQPQEVQKQQEMEQLQQMQQPHEVLAQELQQLQQLPHPQQQHVLQNLHQHLQQLMQQQPQEQKEKLQLRLQQRLQQLMQQPQDPKEQLQLQFEQQVQQHLQQLMQQQNPQQQKLRQLEQELKQQIQQIELLEKHQNARRKVSRKRQESTSTGEIQPNMIDLKKAALDRMLVKMKKTVAACETRINFMEREDMVYQNALNEESLPAQWRQKFQQIVNTEYGQLHYFGEWANLMVFYNNNLMSLYLLCIHNNDCWGWEESFVAVGKTYMEQKGAVKAKYGGLKLVDLESKLREKVEMVQMWPDYLGAIKEQKEKLLAKLRKEWQMEKEYPVWTMAIDIADTERETREVLRKILRKKNEDEL